MVDDAVPCVDSDPQSLTTVMDKPMVEVCELSYFMTTQFDWFATG